MAKRNTALVNFFDSELHEKGKSVEYLNKTIQNEGSYSDLSLPRKDNQ